jgi:hypothetical protein
MAEKLKSTLADMAPNKDAHAHDKLPAFDDLPLFHEFVGCAWDVWGKGDQLGTVNLLTDEVVRRAANEEVRCVSRRGGEGREVLICGAAQDGPGGVIELVRGPFPLALWIMDSSMLPLHRPINFPEKVRFGFVSVVAAVLILMQYSPYSAVSSPRSGLISRATCPSATMRYIS